jgi:IS30 family transposase
LSHLQFNRKRKPGKHLRYTDRQLIEHVYRTNEKRPRRDRKTQSMMAKELGISESTLSRELHRGAVIQLRSDLTEYTSYSADVAQADYDRKSSRKGPGLKIGNDHKLAEHCERLLLGLGEDGKKVRPYSPDAVIMHFEHRGWPTATRICTRTLYSYIEKDVFFGVTQKDLPRGGRVLSAVIVESAAPTRFLLVVRSKTALKRLSRVQKQGTGRWIALSRSRATERAF